MTQMSLDSGSEGNESFCLELPPKMVGGHTPLQRLNVRFEVIPPSGIVGQDDEAVHLSSYLALIIFLKQIRTWAALQRNQKEVARMFKQTTLILFQGETKRMAHITVPQRC